MTWVRPVRGSGDAAGWLAGGVLAGSAVGLGGAAGLAVAKRPLAP